jgi:GMP synthase-like glutamine amidotransferase/tetratricopeptide (TPR) repeat protein
MLPVLMRALALEHLWSNQLGVYGEVLAERGIEVDVVRLDEGDVMPDWRGYDVLVVMGGPMSAYDEAEFPWLQGEKRAIREAVESGVPYFGVCLGSQLLASSLGARVYRGPAPELGVNPVFLTEAARRDPVFRGFPSDLEAFEWHSDTFELPEGATRLARSPRYENQAFRFGRVAYAMQCHLEPSLEDVNEWLRSWPALAVTFEQRYGGGAVERFLADYAETVPFLQQTARQLFRRWLEHSLAMGGGPGLARTPRARGEGGLLGRDAELARTRALLAAARDGSSGALVVRGVSGIGKSALLGYACAAAAGFRVLRATGEEGHSQYPFGGLRALFGAVLFEEGDSLAVGAGVLRRLAAESHAAPLLVIVDDAHWLDEESLDALSFAVKRLAHDPIAVLLAVRDEDTLAGSGLDELRLSGLDRQAARALVERTVPPPLSAAVVERILDVAEGNPLGLLEIPRSLTRGQLAGETPLGDALATLASAEQAFLERAMALPDGARQALLTAALADTPCLETIEVALDSLGLSSTDLRAAASAGLISLSADELAFRHPLVRSTVAYNTLPSERRAAHASLAVALQRSDGDAVAWHRARAISRPDEGVAAGLVAAGERARERHANSVAAQAFEFAARLTPAQDVRSSRLLAAAECASLAGHAISALDLAQLAASTATSDEVRVKAVHLQGRILSREGSAARARDVLLDAAAASEESEPGRAALLLADAVIPCLRAGQPVRACEVGRRAVELASGRGKATEAAADLMFGLALLLAGDTPEGAARVEAAARLAADGALDDEPQLRGYLGLALGIAGDFTGACAVLDALTAQARATGAGGLLPYALARRADVDLDTGCWPEASARLHEARRLSAETGQAADHGIALGSLSWLHAVQGREEACRACAEEALDLAERLGVGSAVERSGSALGLLELGLQRYPEAVVHFERVSHARLEGAWSDAGVFPHRLPDLIEAYAGAGRPEDARRVLAVFDAQMTRSRRPSAAAASARCRAILEEDAEASLLRALEIEEDATGPFERARTLLWLGRWLREHARAAEAEEPLRNALSTFGRLGAEPWTAQARHELELAGLTPEPRETSPLDRLGEDELSVMLALADGASVDDAAATLVLTPRTVEHHLRRALDKLGIRSPDELHELV